VDGVFPPHVFSFSSNWKELRTLCQMMEDLVDRTHDVVRGMTVFYFTDNSTVCYAVNKGASASTELQNLIVRIKLAELQLGCLLEAIHVHGVVMIIEGTDGLSRGVWVSPLHQAAGRVLTTAHVLDPAPYSPLLVPWILHQAGLPATTPVTYRPWDGCWTARPLLHQTTLWYPPPEIARQVIVHVMSLGVESPWGTQVFIFVPRILQHQWGNLSKHVHEVGIFQPGEFPLSPLQHLPIPVVLLQIATYKRTLPSIRDEDMAARLDGPPAPPDARWHRNEAELLRGL
jgi:hypothetical protein